MRTRLRQKLATGYLPKVLVYNSFDVVGDMAIIKIPNDNMANAEAVANQIMSLHNQVKTVFLQTSPVKGDYRVRELKLVAGENKTTTLYKESGCIFAVDIAKCYFSPRLSYERARVASLVKPHEVIVNMFSGVGCFSIAIAKLVSQSRVYSIDINPIAIQFMIENVRINRVNGQVIPIIGDAQFIVNSKFKGIADRVLMPLPEKALEYLSVAVLALKKSGGWIHYYDFEHATKLQNPIDQTKLKVATALENMAVRYDFGLGRVVRSTGPNWYQIALDIHVASMPSKF